MRHRHVRTSSHRSHPPRRRWIQVVSAIAVAAAAGLALPMLHGLGTSESPDAVVADMPDSAASDRADSIGALVVPHHASRNGAPGRAGLSTSPARPRGALAPRRPSPAVALAAPRAHPRMHPSSPVAGSPAPTITEGGQTPNTPATTAPASPTPTSVDSFTAQVVGLTNSQRAQVGCPALTVDGRLNTAAQGHSLDMASHHYFSHTGQDGRSPWDRIAAAGYSFGTAAENIAAGQRTPRDVVDSWMRSPGHRANIVNCSLRQIGVGYAVSSSSTYGIYWTQDFAAPR